MHSHFWPFAERADNAAHRFPRWRALGSFLPAFLAFAWFHNSAQAASSVKLVWDRNPESDIAGYRIYYGTVSRTYTGMVNAGNATNCVVPGLIEGKTYYFAGTAYNTAGLESDFSNEVVHTSLYPTITLTAPANGTTSLAPATLNLAAQVVTNGHAILKVSFHNGATLLGEDLAPPYAFPWSNVPAGSYILTARLHYDAGSVLASAPANVIVAGLPAPWQTADIGGGQLAGSAGAIDGVFTVKGAGPLGSTSDRFRFVFQSLSGDGEIKAALRSLATSGTNDWAGVMIRESLNGDSRYSFMGLSQSGSISSKSRRSTGGTASSTASGTAAMPNAWFRLVRTGNTIQDYKSIDGVNWILMNSRIVTMATNIQVGLAVASASTNSLATATFNQVTVVP